MDTINRRDTIRFSESCRLCLRKPGIYNVFKIKGLLLDIYEFTGVKVFLAGDLPQTICKECSTVIQNAKELKEIATINDVHMRSLVSDKIEPSKPIEQVIIEQPTDTDIYKSSTATNDIKPVKTEYVPPEEITCEDGSSNSQLAYDTHGPLKFEKDDGEKKEPQVENIESMYDFEASLITETCAQWFPPDVPEDILKVEDAESAYRCETCAKDFTTWKKFYYHNRFHNKSIECGVDGCLKKFATRGDLEKHMRTHTGEKPYQCELCSRRFTQKGTLKVHRVMVHSINKEVIIGI